MRRDNENYAGLRPDTDSVEVFKCSGTTRRSISAGIYNEPLFVRQVNEHTLATTVSEQRYFSFIG
jgi:hypothetical protein